MRLFQAIKVLGLCAAMGLGLMVRAQATDLIISEYVEGSGNNKYIELYNGTSASIALNNYRLQLFSNGSPTPTQNVLLTGTLAAGATIVYKNSSATIYTGSATTNTAVDFNGDDAIALYKVSTSSFVDIFGNIGCDPGSNWSSGSLSTENKTLVRNANICNGISVDPGNPPCSFPTLASEWTQYSEDDVSHLGSHTMTCG
ncbi:MAG: lamin tail domain-containing protein, partial [Flavobacteriales bacterium]|nr:lamin tail domain-containing protein [Flavobacteriales bacterium]